MPGEKWRFYDKPAAPAADIGGEWLLETKGEGGERGLALLRQTGNQLEGTIQFPSGDVRFLAGEMSGADFALSTFDGNQGSLWRGRRLPDGTLAGESFEATSTAPTPFVARPKAGPADDVVAVAEAKPPVDRIAFTFPDASGKPVVARRCALQGQGRGRRDRRHLVPELPRRGRLPRALCEEAPGRGARGDRPPVRIWQ